ncbi:MAG: GHMP kinase [Acidobacteriota bacterium]|jgi:D-glycero-alpha-D-manno-heptose-7-phosphate kinase|nr:GHMP kinase [Acidobacteriota bacterium]
MIIESSAPTRVDLAGGTIDIPPLFLFHEGAATVNFAIDLLARVRIETRSDDKIILESIDRGVTFESSLDKIGELAFEPCLELLAKLVYFFKPEVGFNMTTDSEAPAGAGLAGSSTLNIACIGALNALVGNRYAPEKFIPIAANVECQVIKVPTGFQDYYSAQYGGAACIHFRSDGMEREALDIDTKTLENRVVVLYTGEPRNSGTNNWEITKRHIDGDKETFDIFEGIRNSSLSLREALLNGDWNEVGEILQKAHPQRKRLSPNITTPNMDTLIEKALENGAIAAKVCGAGGGGCIAFFCEENQKADVEAALAEEQDVEVLDWKISTDGLVINES